LYIDFMIILLNGSWKPEYILNLYCPNYIHRLGSVCVRHLGEAPIGRIAYWNKKNGLSKDSPFFKI
jgi:hypothetical protein